MPKLLHQIADDAVKDFLAQRKTAAEIVADVKRDFSLREELFAVADALLASPHPELRAAGRLVEVLAAGWTREVPDDYLRGTNILVNKPCTCADPRAVDRTCPRYGAPDHGQVVARRWVDGYCPK